MGFRLSPATNILIDLTDVTFMDPTGVGALLGLYRIAAKRGGYVTMANPSYTVLRVLEVLALTPLFEIVNRPLSQAGVPSAS
jgi:anti-anti-sigma factor